MNFTLLTRAGRCARKTDSKIRAAVTVDGGDRRQWNYFGKNRIEKISSLKSNLYSGNSNVLRSLEKCIHGPCKLNVASDGPKVKSSNTNKILCFRPTNSRIFRF
jgi:hypothetical protein